MGSVPQPGGPVTCQNFYNSTSAVSKLLMLHMNQVAMDIDNRPNEMGDREIKLTLKFRPKKSVNSEPTDRVGCTIDCKTKTPIWQTSEYDMRITRAPRANGQTQFGFAFSEDFAENASQNPLPGTRPNDTDGDHR